MAKALVACPGCGTAFTSGALPQPRNQVAASHYAPLRSAGYASKPPVEGRHASFGTGTTQQLTAQLGSSFFSFNSSSRLAVALPPSKRRGLAARRGVRAQAGGSAKLVTFLGKGGSGKTTAAVLLAKAYAAEGKRTVLVVQGQDRVAETLLGRKLPTAPEPESPGSALSVVRLEATKLLLEPLAQLKKLDARLGFSSGALQEVVGEELSILPSMDTLLAAGALEKLTDVTGILTRQQTGSTWDGVGRFDVVVYDGPSNSDIVRLFGAAERARWYLSRFRRLAEKTDAGRVLLPTAARAVDSVLSGGTSAPGDSKPTGEVWKSIERVLDGAAEYFTDPQKFTAFLVSKQGSKNDLSTALRLWGCAAQAGLFVGGLLLSPGAANATPPEEEFAPLLSLTLPAAEDSVGESASGLGGSLAGLVDAAALCRPEPRVDPQTRTVTFFLPGFDKSEIKLSQYQKGAELLVEAGDQRRSISIPQGMRGKVSGAKFSKNFLTVTLKPEVAKV